MNRPVVFPITKEVWSLPLDEFRLVCDDESMSPDPDGYPLAPNGNNFWRFPDINDNINVLMSYWNWVSKRSAEKIVLKVNNVNVVHTRYVFQCKGMILAFNVH
jgi:hypothetical protein